MNEITKIKEVEIIKKTELIIRGHHLYRFVELLSNIPELKNLPETLPISKKLVTDLYGFSQKFVNKLKKNEEEYVQDVLGDSNQEEEFKKNLVLQFLLFLTKAPGYPVILTTGIDGICSGCATGSHCHILNKYDQILLKRIAKKLDKQIIQENGGHIRLELSLAELRHVVLLKEFSTS